MLTTWPRSDKMVHGPHYSSLPFHAVKSVCVSVSLSFSLSVGLAVCHFLSRILGSTEFVDCMSRGIEPKVVMPL